MNDIRFTETDAAEIEKSLISIFEAQTGESLYPGDERRLFLMNFVPVLVGIKNAINDTGKQNLLRYARGEALNALGRFYSTYRLEAQKATVTLEFVLAGVQTQNVIIPKGTRATPDGKLYYATSEDLVIQPGDTKGRISAIATDSGAKHNDLTPGQIKSLVDPIPFVVLVMNTSTSMGGSDIESDDAYRLRIQQAPEKFSVAGTEGAYIYWAKSADVNIVDVTVTSSSPGIVSIVPLMVNGQIPSQDLLNKVLDEVLHPERKPLTDWPQVHAPVKVHYDINITYYIPYEMKEHTEEIRAKIESTEGAIQQYIKWQHSKLGRQINPDELRFRILSAGACRVNIVSPTYTTIAANQFADVDQLAITYGGIE